LFIKNLITVIEGAEKGISYLTVCNFYLKKESPYLISCLITFRKVKTVFSFLSGKGGLSGRFHQPTIGLLNWLFLKGKKTGHSFIIY